MAKVAVSEALYRVADRCVQILGGLGVTRDTIVERVFRELRAFRIYDGPSDVHRWSIANKIKRDVAAGGLVAARFAQRPIDSSLSLFLLLSCKLKYSILIFRLGKSEERSVGKGCCVEGNIRG